MYLKQIEIIRSNVSQLIVRDGIPSENSLAKLAGIDQKTVNNLLADDTLPNPTAKVLDALASVFHIAPWMLWVKSFPFDVVGIKPLETVSSEGYRLLAVFEKLPDDKRKSILDYVLFQINETAPEQANQIRDVRAHYKALTVSGAYKTCDEDFS